MVKYIFIILILYFINKLLFVIYIINKNILIYINI